MIAAVITLLSAIVPLQKTPASTFVVNDNMVYRLYSSGRVESLGRQFSLVDHGFGISGIGSTDALVSPDGRYIAFTHKRNMWVWDGHTRKIRQLTKVGSEPSNKLNGVNVLLSDWSSDSTRILYYIGEDIVGEEPAFPNAVTRPIRFGFHIYNMVSHQSQPANRPRTSLERGFDTRISYEAWLPSGDFIGTAESTGIVLIDSKTGEKQVIAPSNDPLGYSQVRVDRDGKFLLASAHIRNGSMIVKINLATKEITQISPEGKFAEYQWPSFSPSGQHVGYLRVSRELNQQNSAYEYIVTVDEREVFHDESQILPRVAWIDDSVVAIIGRDDVAIVDVQTGNEMSRTTLTR